jgi:alpha-galactosidase
LNVTIAAGLDPSEREFRSRLADGQRFVTPTVFVGCYRGDLDDGANRLHRFVAIHLRPPVSDARYPLVVDNSWGSGMAVDEALARHMIDDSATLGVELFHLDAGWFHTVGDWHPDAKKFPNGLAPISDYAHSKGMLFGLWVGWTQGGTESRGMETLAVTNPEQRDWFTHDYPATWKPADFTGATVCLGDEPSRAWCLNDLRRIVTSYKLDLLEHDQIMIVDQCDRTDHGHTASPADIAYHAARGYYFVYDQLRKEHPNLLFEDCVNGGRTVDFGIVRRTHYISITDTYDPLSNRRAFYDSSFPLPPSMCECYIENKPGPSLATFKTMLRSGMMGWCTLMCDTGGWSAEQHKAAIREIELYKQWIRPLINMGDLFHVSTRPDEARWDGMQYFDSKSGKGIVFAFRGATAGETSHAFKLKFLLDQQASLGSQGADTRSSESDLSNRHVQVMLVQSPGAVHGLLSR